MCVLTMPMIFFCKSHSHDLKITGVAADKKIISAYVHSVPVV